MVNLSLRSGQDKKKKAEPKKVVPDNKSKKDAQPKLKKEGKKNENVKEKNHDELSDEEFQNEFLKEAVQDSKSPKPSAEELSNEIPDTDNRPNDISENDIKSEL